MKKGIEKGFYEKIQTKLVKLNELRKSKTVVFLVCTMRSGSTLLKSLLANAPDTSHLPEVDFQKFTNGNAWKIKTLSPSKIIILKKPAPFYAKNYPQIPKVKNAKKIVLIRDVYDTVVSLKKMNQAISSELDGEWTYQKLIQNYWVKTYQDILNLLPISGDDFRIVKYEDIIKNPILETQALFQFIGSSQKEGVSSYFPSKDFNWEWGKDDGGKKIQTLKVQITASQNRDPELIKIIQDTPEVESIRRRLGYHHSNL